MLPHLAIPIADGNRLRSHPLSLRRINRLARQIRLDWEKAVAVTAPLPLGWWSTGVDIAG
jgi:hypothetical protein